MIVQTPTLKATKQRRCILLEPLRELKYSDAIAEYGTAHMLFEHGHSRPSVFDSKRFCDSINEALEKMDFNAEVDYIVMSGSMNALVQLSAVVAAQGPFTMLLYCAGKGGYIEAPIE